MSRADAHRGVGLRSVVPSRPRRRSRHGVAGPGRAERERIARALAAAGCVAADAEADELLAASRDGVGRVDELLERRLRGEPVAWITGRVRFCGHRIHVDPGVFVPRPQTEILARRAAALLPADGTAVDLCTGSGAVAAVLRAARPGASVLATDADPLAVACAARNGVRVFRGDLDEPLPAPVRGRVDVVSAVVPYVPTEALHLLPADVLAYEPRAALDGGLRGTTMLLRAVDAARRLLGPGGSVLLELGAGQVAEVARAMLVLGLSDVRVHRDEDGQDRAIEARRPGDAPWIALGTAARTLRDPRS